MSNRQRLTSKFYKQKAFSILMFLLLIFIIFVQIISSNMEYIFGLVLFLIIPVIVWYIVKTRNIVYYDNEEFYIYNWKGVEIDVVANEQITSMLFSGAGLPSLAASYRLFYTNRKNVKKEFWIIPNWGTNPSIIEKKLKDANPELLTSQFSFGGIEHLFLRNEESFKNKFL